MLLVLAKVIIGVAAIGAGGAAVYGVYKLITRESARREINIRLQEEDIFKEAFKAKVIQKQEKSIGLEMLDSWDEPQGYMHLDGDEVSSDIEIGDVIIL